MEPSGGRTQGLSAGITEMEKLLTPFGEIRVLIDANPVPYAVREARREDPLWPHILGRYRIAASFIPDGKEHSIACVFEADGPYERTPESGEGLECQGFYNGRRFKMSIALACEAGCIDGMRTSDAYDYDAAYLDNGMAFLIGPDTKTQEYEFGIAWIDDVGWDDPIDEENDREVETWYAADPTLAL